VGFTWPQVIAGELFHYNRLNSTIKTVVSSISFICKRRIVIDGRQLERVGTGVGTSKILGVRRIFARVSQTCPKKLLRDFSYKFSPTKIMKTFFWYDLWKTAFICFSAPVGRQFWKSNNVGRHFWPDFQEFCLDI